MKYLILIIFTFLLTLGLQSCKSINDDKQEYSVDGYSFGKPEFERSTFTILLYPQSSLEELRKRHKEITGKDAADSLMAFTAYNPKVSVCKIYIIDPKIKYMPEYIGHEMLHCAYGQWHTDNFSFD